MGQIINYDEEYVGNYAVRTANEYRLKMVDNDFKGYAIKRMGIINKNGKYILPADESFSDIKIIDGDFAIVTLSNDTRSGMLIHLGELSYEIVRQFSECRLVSDNRLIISMNIEVLYDYINNRELSQQYTVIEDYKPHLDGSEELFARASIIFSPNLELYGYIDLNGNIRSNMCSTIEPAMINTMSDDFDFEEEVDKARRQYENIRKFRKMDDTTIVKSIKR